MTPRYFNPQNCIEHRHPKVHSWGNNRAGEYVMHCIEPPQYEIVIYCEGWGHLPVNGSGNKVRSEIPETKGKPIYCLNQAERDAFMAQYFTYTWEYEEEQRNASLTSASV
jgi:hypothetical protein